MADPTEDTEEREPLAALGQSRQLEPAIGGSVRSQAEPNVQSNPTTNLVLRFHPLRPYDADTAQQRCLSRPRLLPLVPFPSPSFFSLEIFIISLPFRA